jgi:hypothetical protein
MISSLQKYLSSFIYTEDEKRSPTVVESVSIAGSNVPQFTNEFWTSRQRQAHSLHEVSYRACFKPQLPRFFIERLTKENDLVYDPFSGRGTTVLEAALLGRKIAANDVNPLSRILSQPRISPPTPEEIEQRLHHLRFAATYRSDIPLSMFYHKETLREILSLRKYLMSRAVSGSEDYIDRWIRMVATNRLTGHSKGFFSVYTLPPNQALSPESQKKINALRKQKPEYRDTKKIILKKSRQLFRDLTVSDRNRMHRCAKTAKFITGDARLTRSLKAGSVQLTVTSPPFLDIVQYAHDNWLRCWFNGIDDGAVAQKITMSRTIDQWSVVMAAVFRELFRITKKGGRVVFEVGEVRKGKIKLEEYVVQLGVGAGFRCEAIMINRQNFTKTANIWGVSNNTKGTNSNRIIIFIKQ